MNRLIRAGCRIATTIFLGAGAVAGYTAWMLNAPRRPWPSYTFTPFEVGVPAENVSFTASDGALLAGWWLERPGSQSVVICCHGHRGSKADMLGIGPGLWRAGHNVLLIDFRGNGDSGDGRQSLAHYEQADLAAAVNWALRSCPGARIAVMAFSMGAAAAILTAANDPRIEALVLDSPFATMSGVIAANYRRYRLPGGLLLPVADLVNRVFYGYAFGQVRPVDAMSSLSPRPVLLLHGTKDRLIPYEHAHQLVAAAGPGEVELVTFEGADHCGGYFIDRPGYIARVDRFLEAAFRLG